MSQVSVDISQILDAHYDAIFAFSVRALGCRQEAEDLTQDVCLSLSEKLPEFRGDAKVTSWLYRIVINAAHDRMRKQMRYARAGADWGSREIALKEDQQNLKEGQTFLREAMMRMDPSDRITLALVVTGGFSQAEVAEILDVAPGTVAWRMSEIKKNLASMACPQGEVA